MLQKHEVTCTLQVSVQLQSGIESVSVQGHCELKITRKGTSSTSPAAKSWRSALIGNFLISRLKIFWPRHFSVDCPIVKSSLSLHRIPPIRFQDAPPHRRRDASRLQEAGRVYRRLAQKHHCAPRRWRSQRFPPVAEPSLRRSAFHGQSGNVNCP